MKYAYFAWVIAILLILISGLGLTQDRTDPSQPGVSSYPNASQYISAQASCTYLGSDMQLGSMNQGKTLTILVTLEFRNSAQLSQLLMNLQDPFSPEYHRYLTEKEFISEFSPSYTEYNSYVNYFKSNGLNVSRTFEDRVSISLTATVRQFEDVFHTEIMVFKSPERLFFAPDAVPSLEANFGKIASISGLSDRFVPSLSPLFTGSGTDQTLYGSDFQAAYQLNQLFKQYGYPSNSTIATILWTGHTSSNVSVAPFDPVDISTYFKNNLPSGEPVPSVYGYPVCGALPPGQSAQYDSTQANVESTLDLEMAGSMAPGASIVEVYGSAPSISDLNVAFASVLSPSYNATVDSALSKVVAISNSWGTQDCNDSTWMQYEMEAAARGITVIASSGDNGNTPSPVPSFPASMAYNNFGTLAVGGAFTYLSGTQSSNGSGTTGISSEAVWFNTPDPGNGSQGGVSKIFPEPNWQQSSSYVSKVISGAEPITGVASGRGTPDIAADGANMSIYISINGQAGYADVDGTSIASPLVAGQIAVIDHSLGKPEGFINPLLYKLGQEQISGNLSGKPVFYIIRNGTNADFAAGNGYSLSVGWGSINSYNLVSNQLGHLVTFNESGLSSGKWFVNVSGRLESALSGSNITYCLPNGSYSYNVSSANQSYLAYPSSGNISVNGSKSVDIKFKVSRFSASFEESGLPSATPWSIYIYNQTANISYRSSTSKSIQLFLKNGTYMYFANSKDPDYRPLNGSGTFTVSGNRSLNITIMFDPVLYVETFIEKGLPSGFWYVNITSSTGQTLNASSNTSEIIVDLMNGTYTYHAGSFNLSYFNSSLQELTVAGGKPSVVNITFRLYVMPVIFSETGLPAGTEWSVTLGNQTVSGTNTSIVFYFANSTISFNVSAIGGYSASPSNGSIIVNGHRIMESITFSRSKPTGILGSIYNSILSSREIQILLTLLALTFISAGIVASGRRRR